LIARSSQADAIPRWVQSSFAKAVHCKDHVSRRGAFLTLGRSACRSSCTPSMLRCTEISQRTVVVGHSLPNSVVGDMSAHNLIADTSARIEVARKALGRISRRRNPPHERPNGKADGRALSAGAISIQAELYAPSGESEWRITPRQSALRAATIRKRPHSPKPSGKKCESRRRVTFLARTDQTKSAGRLSSRQRVGSARRNLLVSRCAAN
jgi:hypothetical protein